MKVVTSGIDYIDATLGGGIVKDSSLLVIYDSISSGWALPFKIINQQIRRDALGILINYNLPLPKLLLRAKSAGLDIEKEGKRGNLFVIDAFGSKYGSQSSEEYVYTIGGFNPETYIPKLEQIYRDIFRKTNREKVVDFVFSLDGMAFELGESRSIKLIKRLLSNPIINGRHLFSISLISIDRVSKEFLSWNIEFSDYVIEFSGKKHEHGIYEEMYIIKSPLSQFESRGYRYDPKQQGIMPLVAQKGRETTL